MRLQYTTAIVTLTTIASVCLAQTGIAPTNNKDSRPGISISDIVANPSLLDGLEVVEWSDSDRTSDDTLEAGSNLDFGSNIAGAYYVCPGCSFFGQSIRTLTADGTLINQGAVVNETAGYGAWKKVGPKTIEVTAVVYGQDPTGANPTFVARVTETLTFANGFGSYTGLLNTAVWFGNIDLNNPAGPPDLCAGPFEVSGTRLGVQYPSCSCGLIDPTGGALPGAFPTCDAGESCVDDGAGGYACE